MSVIQSFNYGKSLIRNNRIITDVISLLHFEGPDSSSVFIEETLKQNWYGSNEAQIDTAQQYFGTSSLFLPSPNNTSPYSHLYAFNTPTLSLGTSMFTIEMFFKIGGAYDNRRLFSIGETGESGNFAFGLGSSGGLFVYINVEMNGLSNTYEFTSLSTTPWHHVRLVRNSGGYLNVWLNGTPVNYSFGQPAERNMPHDINNSGVVRIGYDFEGWIDEFRLVTGIDLYEQNGGLYGAGPSQNYTLMPSSNFPVPTQAYDLTL